MLILFLPSVCEIVVQSVPSPHIYICIHTRVFEYINKDACLCIYRMAQSFVLNFWFTVWIFAYFSCFSVCE